MKLLLIFFFSVCLVSCSTTQNQATSSGSTNVSAQKELGLDKQWVWISQSTEAKFFYRPDSVEASYNSIEFSMLVVPNDKSKREEKGWVKINCDINTIGYANEFNRSAINFVQVEKGTVNFDVRAKLCGTSFPNGLLIFLAGDLNIDNETGLSLWIAKDYIRSQNPAGSIRVANGAYQLPSGLNRLFTVWADCEQLQISFSAYPEVKRPNPISWRNVEALAYRDKNSFSLDNAVFDHLCFPRFGKVISAGNKAGEVGSSSSTETGANEVFLLRKRIESIDAKYKSNFRAETIPLGGEMSESEARFCIFQSKRLEKIREKKEVSSLSAVLLAEWSTACSSATISAELKQKIVKELDAKGGRLRKILEKVASDYQKAVSK
jgi:hypothetical protein